MPSLTSEITALCQETGFRGALLVRRGGEMSLEQHHGPADLESGRPITAQTAFQLCSVSKQFAGVALLLLQEDGALATNDPISRWVPESPPAWGGITLHHLLTHTSGLGHWQDYPGLSLFDPKPRAELLRIFAGRDPSFAPGTGWSYSSPGYVLLAYAVEAASGLPYAGFLATHIFQPLEMGRSGAGNHAPHPAEEARPYSGDQPTRPFELDTVALGAGDLWSTCGDLERWNAALSRPGFLSAGSLTQLFAPYAPVPGNTPPLHDIHYGYGWFVCSVQGHPVAFHPGDNAGFQSFFARLPDDDALVIALTNNDHFYLERFGLNLIELVLAPAG